MIENIIAVLIDNFIWLGIFALLLGIFYFALDPRRYKKLDKTLNKEAAKSKKSFESIFGALIIIGVVFIIFKGLTYGYESINSYFDNKSETERICAERIEDIKNEFTAKKIYESCMKR